MCFCVYFERFTWQDHDQLLQTTLRWWEKVTTTTATPKSASNDVAPSTKKPANGGDKKADDRSIDDKLKRDSLPLFVVDPVDAFIIRSKPADLTCRVVGADKAYFTCNGEAMAAADRHKEEDRVEVVGDQVRLGYSKMIFLPFHSGERH